MSDACKHKKTKTNSKTRETRVLKSGEEISYDVAHAQCLDCYYLFSLIAPGDLKRGAA